MGGMVITGPDCSRHQGVVDWAAVRRGGHTFAWCKLTDGLAYRFVDWGRTNLPKVRAAGLVPGAYHWLDAGPNGELHDPRGQARYFVAEIANAGGIAGLMCALDVELERNTAGSVISNPEIDSVSLFADEFRRLTNNHPLVIYTGGWYWRGIGNPTGAGLGPLWHSEYEPTRAEVDDGPELDSYGGWTQATFWQFTSNDQGLGMDVPGVSTLCDLNIFYGDPTALAALTGVSVPAPPVPEEDLMLIVQCNEGPLNGAALLVSGSRAYRVMNNTELGRLRGLGIDYTPVSLAQFDQFAADVTGPVNVPAIAAAVGVAVAEALADDGQVSGDLADTVEAAVRRVFADAAG
jgi:lysozyme